VEGAFWKTEIGELSPHGGGCGWRQDLKVSSVEEKPREERSVKRRLKGHVVTYGSVELTIDGNRMTGKSSAGLGRDLKLTKSK
jgi:hypothetical protein